MDTETLWQEIASTALLGTQRKPFSLAPAAGDPRPLGQVLRAAQNPDQPLDAERLLLRSTAIAAIHRKAGRVPPVGTAQPVGAPCPEDDWSRCSPQAGLFLEEILSNGKSALLPEWVEMAAQAQKRVREEHLPLLLGQQKLIQPIRAALLPVLGERGRWLAGRNPEWIAFVTFSDEHIWHEGQRKERLAFLTDLRARDPQRARELLTETWPQESPAERLVFLEALENRLSMADEGFLESVLDDRRKDVRQAAAGLLARLTESRLVQRMRARNQKALVWKNGILRSSMEINLPEACDEAMVRDGLEARPPAALKLGERAWWLAQILSMVPARTWSAAWNRRPAQILDAAHKSEWEDALMWGWTEAALRYEEADWLEAILAHEIKRERTQRVFEFFPRMPAALQERTTLSLLRNAPSLSYEQPTSVYLSNCRHPWSTELTQAVIACLCETIQKGEMQPWRWEKLLRDIAPYFHPTLLEPAVQRISAALKKKEGSDASVNHLLSTLQFRLEMRQAF